MGSHETFALAVAKASIRFDGLRGGTLGPLAYLDTARFPPPAATLPPASATVLHCTSKRARRQIPPAATWIVSPAQRQLRCPGRFAPAGCQIRNLTISDLGDLPGSVGSGDNVALFISPGITFGATTFSAATYYSLQIPCINRFLYPCFFRRLPFGNH